MKCPNCQTEINENAKFCQECGRKVDTSEDQFSYQLTQGDFQKPNGVIELAIIMSPAQGHDWLAETIIKSIEREKRKRSKETKITLKVLKGFVLKEPELRKSDAIVTDKIPKTKVKDSEAEQKSNSNIINYNPRVDLPDYKFPPISILKDYKTKNHFDETIIVGNKDAIKKILKEHKIKVNQISETVGPTVTLYEVVPELGVKLARFKLVENDIANALSVPEKDHCSYLWKGNCWN
jgi:DNA segregation ATPase FtsK/SpoIIIE-like protein